MKLIAHRGASGEHRENSMAAFEAALAAGVDGIETDVQLTRDGVPVMYHDKVHHGKPIREIHSNELKDLQIDRLDTVLEQHGHKTLWLLELKPADNPPQVNRDLVAATMRLVLEHNCLEHVALLCFDLDLLQLAHKWYPVRCALNLAKSEPSKPEWDFLWSISTNIKKTKAEDVATWRNQEKGNEKFLMTWTCNSIDHIQNAADLELDAFMTDWPARPAFRSFRKT